MKNPILAGLLLGAALISCPPSSHADEDAAQPAVQISPGEVDQSLGQLNDKLTESRAVPYFENGKQAGYRTYEGTSPRAELKDEDAKDSEPASRHELQLLSTGVQTNRMETITHEGEDQ